MFRKVLVKTSAARCCPYLFQFALNCRLFRIPRDMATIDISLGPWARSNVGGLAQLWDSQGLASADLLLKVCGSSRRPQPRAALQNRSALPRLWVPQRRRPAAPPVFVNDLRQRAQGLIHFPWVLKDCGYVRIKRHDARALLVAGGVLVGSSPAEIVFGENVIPVSLSCISRFTKVSLHSLCVRGGSPAGR